ncbi:MAG TPA: hypothetical protein V6D02_10795, partial [Candidatus Obscuribacterales bacterium]
MKRTRQFAYLGGLTLAVVSTAGLLSAEKSPVNAQVTDTIPELELAGDRPAWFPSSAAEPTVLNNVDPSPSTDRVVPGDDDRVPMNNRDYPWSAVGRIVAETADGSISLCTGTLV